MKELNKMLNKAKSYGTEAHNSIQNGNVGVGLYKINSSISELEKALQRLSFLNTVEESEETEETGNKEAEKSEEVTDTDDTEEPNNLHDPEESEGKKILRKAKEKKEDK